MGIGFVWSMYQVVVRRNKNNRARGKHYENRVGDALGGWRNLD